MDWRLGRWECRCGNSEDPAEEAARAAQQQRSAAPDQPSGRGIQRKPIYRDGKVVGYESEQDAATYTAPSPSLLGSRTDAFDPYARGGGSGDDALSQEKRYWLMAEIGWSVIMAIFMSIFLAGNPQVGFQSGLTLAIFIPTFVIGMGIHLAIMWWILFGAEIWAKWTCLGCNGCGLLSTIASLFAPAAMLASQQQFQMMPGWLQVVSSVVQLGMGIWLISLLYRDIQARQGM